MKGVLLIVLTAFCSVDCFNRLTGSVTTPCGELFNNKTRHGVVSYDQARKRVQIKCDPGYTLKGSKGSIRCNVTSSQWESQGAARLSCEKGKAGNCPVPSGRVVGACIMNCTSDENCTNAGQKCCSNGCGYVCTNRDLTGFLSLQSSSQKLADVLKNCTKENRWMLLSGDFDHIVNGTCLERVFRRLTDKTPSGHLIDNLDRQTVNNLVGSNQTRRALVRMISALGERSAVALLRKVSDDHFDSLYDAIKKIGPRIKRGQLQSTIIKILKKKYGEVNTWPVKMFEGFPGVLTWLPPPDRNAFLDKKHKTKLEEIFAIITLDQAIKLRDWVDGRKMLEKVYGSPCKKWTNANWEKIKFLAVLALKFCVEDMPKKIFCDFVVKLGNNKMSNADKIAKKLAKSGCTGISLTSASLGDLSCGLSRNDLKKLTKSDVKFEFVGRMCKCKRATQIVIRNLVKKLPKVPSSKSKWSTAELGVMSPCLRFLDGKQINTMIPQILALYKTNCTEINIVNPQLLKRLRKEAEKANGKPNTWTGKCLIELRRSTDSVKDIFSNSNAASLKDMRKIKGLSPLNMRAIFMRLKKLAGFILDVNEFIKDVSIKELKKDPQGTLKSMGLADDSTDSEEKRNTREAQDLNLKVGATVCGIQKPTSQDKITKYGPQLVKGLPTKDIKALVDLDAVYEFVKSMGEKLSEKQAKAIVKRFVALGGKTDEETLPRLGKAAASLSEEQRKEILKNPALRALWLEGIRSAKPDNFGSKELEKMTEEAVDPKAKLPISDLLDMGILVVGLKKYDQIDDDVLPEAIALFAKYADHLSDDKKKELVSRLKKIRQGKFTEDDLCDLGQVKNVFTKDDVKDISKEVVQNAVECLTEHARFSIAVGMELMSKLIDASASRRRRRSTDLSTKTSDDILAMGNLVTAYTPAQIRSIPHAVYLEIASEIGKKIGFEQIQLDAWADVAKNGGEAADISPDLIKNLGSVCKGLTADEIGKLNFEDDETIQGCSGQTGFTKEQLSKGLGQIKAKKAKTIAQFTALDFTAINHFAVGMTPDEVASISKDVYSDAAGTLGKLSGWSPEQLEKLKDLAVAAYGPVSGWSSATLLEANAAVGGLSESEIKSLTGDQLQDIPAEAISQIPPSKLKLLSLEQFGYFSSKQNSAITADQRASLSDEQKTQVCKEIDCTTVETPSGSGMVVMGMITLIVPLLTTVLAAR